MGNVGGVLLGALVIMGFNSIVLETVTNFLKAHQIISSSNVFTSPGSWKYMMYGLALILMMRFRPEGLLPSRQFKAEVHPDEPHVSSNCMNILEISDLTVRFGGLTAVNAVSLDIPAKEIVSVIGPNGAGKTTLFNAITGIYDPTSGRISFNGEEARRPFRWTTALMLALVGLVAGLSLVLIVNVEPLWDTAITV